MRAVRQIGHIFKEKHGIAATEFAIVAPFLFLLFLGGFEVSRYVMLHSKLEKAAYTVTDVVSQQTSLTAAQVTQIFAAAAEVMDPFGFDTTGVMIISSVYKNGTSAPTVQWQSTGGGTLSTAVSKIGTVDGAATLPGGLTLNADDNVIIVEAFYQFTPLFADYVLGSTSIYKTAIFKPRLGLLTTTPS